MVIPPTPRALQALQQAPHTGIQPITVARLMAQAQATETRLTTTFTTKPSNQGKGANAPFFVPFPLISRLRG